MTPSVNFDDDNLCVYHAGAVMDFDKAVPGDIWYQYADLQHIKRKAMLLSKEANRYGLGALLTNTYGRTDNETQDALTTWSRNGSSRRGLERFINNEYAAKRSDIRRRTIKSVLRAQRKMKEEGIEDVEYSMKVLSRLSEAFSQDSRNFARVMGKADELALQDDENSSPMKSSSTNPALMKKQQEMHFSGTQPMQSKMPSRTRSPNSVIPGSGAPFTQPSRNLGLSKTIQRASNDLRHYC